MKTFKDIIESAKKIHGKKIAVVSGDDMQSLECICQAEKEGIGNFIIYGVANEIIKKCKEKGINLSSEVVDVKTKSEALSLAIESIRNGSAHILMKGMISSSDFLSGVLRYGKSLGKDFFISQACIYEKDSHEGLTILTDCAINIDLNIKNKIKIIENAVNLSKKISIPNPKVAIIASAETINEKLPETFDAAVLSKLSERGQIPNCIIDGPLPFDVAISPSAAKAKGVNGQVAGNADILVFPSLTCGNAVSKSISIIAKKTILGVTIGSPVPLVFTSRTESINGKLSAIALALVISKGEQ